MARTPQTKGICQFCKREIGKGGVARHLATCELWREAVAEAEKSKRKTETLHHLRIQAEGLSQFWLDLEMRGSAKLQELDKYLRAIWLECCGHMSQFSFGGWGGEELSMSRSIDAAFKPGKELTHIYDFGTESVTLIRPVGQRQGKPVTKHPIVLLMRNVMPPSECLECRRPAGWLCMECLIEDQVWGTLCDEHAKTHPHEEYGEPIPLVNSPRLGSCGYEGPAEPPY